MSETMIYILFGAITALITIVYKTLVARIDKLEHDNEEAMRNNREIINMIFTDIAEIKQMINDMRLESLAKYVTKEDCERKIHDN